LIEPDFYGTLNDHDGDHDGDDDDDGDGDREGGRDSARGEAGYMPRRRRQRQALRNRDGSGGNRLKRGGSVGDIDFEGLEDLAGMGGGIGGGGGFSSARSVDGMGGGYLPFGNLDLLVGGIEGGEPPPVPPSIR